MISGRLIIHPEPVKYKRQEHRYGYWPGADDYEGAWSRYASPPPKGTQMSQAVLNRIVGDAACNGFVIGSRVKRTSGNAGIGTIVQIHTELSSAYDEDNMEFTPFRVTWDESPLFVGGTFNYSIDDISLVSSPQLLLGNLDENISNLPLAC
jgi:hypothetical protein